MSETLAKRLLYLQHRMGEYITAEECDDVEGFLGEDLDTIAEAHAAALRASPGATRETETDAPQPFGPTTTDAIREERGEAEAFRRELEAHFGELEKRVQRYPIEVVYGSLRYVFDDVAEIRAIIDRGPIPAAFPAGIFYRRAAEPASTPAEPRETECR